MALTDINFQQGEKQDMILEIALIAPLDSNDLLTSDFNSALIEEVPVSTGGNNIFIMSE